MSRDSQCSTSSLELMSQETHDVLQALLGNEKNNEQPEFVAQYRINPFEVQIADDNTQESVQINIDRLFSFPNVQCKPETIDFGDSPPNLNDTHPSIKKSCDLPQDRTIITTLGTPDVTSPRHCLVPPNTDFPGCYQFDVGFQEEKGQPVKSAPWTYSHQLKKLFVQMRCVVPIRFIFHCRPPPGSYIKCVAVFQQPEHFREVVERCINHMTKHNDGHCAPKQLLRCENAFTKYETCSYTGRHTLAIPVREFDAGVNYCQEMVQFMCFNSCPGGLNRRPINVIFSFENNGQVLGRKVLDSRICACPGRDRGNEEIADNKKSRAANSTANSTANVNSNATQPQPDQAVSSCHETPPATPIDDSINHDAEDPMYKRPPLKRSATKITEGFEVQSLSAYNKKVKREVDEEFTITVNGREKYELLLKIKEGLDLMDMVPQTFLDSYRAGCPPSGPNWFIEKQTKDNEEKARMEDSSRGLHLSNSQNQNSDSEGTPPSTFPLSQLSRTSSNTSSQGNKDSEYSTVRFSLKRTVSLERKGLKIKEIEGNENLLKIGKKEIC